MEPLPANRQRTIEVAAIGVAWLPLLLSAADEIQLVDPAQYAEVARRIVVAGQLTHLHDANGPYNDKPPITFWLIAAALKLLGQSSLAVRLPSLLLSIVLLGCVYRIGAELWGARTGRLAALLLAPSISFQLMVVDPKIDMVVTTFMTGTLLAVVVARRRPMAIYGAWASAALGVLTKGPIGLVAPTLAVLPEVLRRRWGEPASDRGLLSRLAPFRPVTGPLLFLVMVGPWFWENQQEFGDTGPEFILWKQSFGRLFERTYRNDTSPLFFLHTALWAFLPFTPVLLFELGRRLLDWKRAGFRLPPDEGRVVLWWLLLPFAGISASSYKLPQYLYWLSPPAALLAARALTRLGEAGSERTLGILGRIHFGLGAAGLLLIGGLLEFSFVPAIGWRVLWMLVAVALLGLGAALSRRLAAEGRVALLCATAALGFDFFFSGYLHRALLEYQPDGRFGERVLAVDPSGVVLPFIDAAPNEAAGFYARRDVATLEIPQLVEAVRSGRTRVAITSEEAVAKIEAAGLHPATLLDLPVFPTSRPTGKFLNARTRSSVVHRMRLLELTR